MIQLMEQGGYLVGGELMDFKTNLETINQKLSTVGKQAISEMELNQAKNNTIAYNILSAHNTSNNMDQLAIKFDAMASHDITYVGIVQTAKASGLTEFPIPYVLTNCHNSLCAVGGTINEDDHVFGLSAAKKYGGIYVPAHQAVIHTYMREMMSGCGKMILGSDSHTRYGALGTMAMGEGGPELVKQLLKRTYDVAYPEVVGIYLEGKPVLGVGPQDVALAIIGEVFKSGFVKNRVMEFVGPGVSNLSVMFRNGIDVMTTETTCLSSIWRTDKEVLSYFTTQGRPEVYKELNPGDVTYYDRVVKVDLSAVKPMIALPFHPSNTYTIDEVNANAKEILATVEDEAKKIFGNNDIDYVLTDKIKDNKVLVDQGVVAGCSGGTYENIFLMGEMIDGKSTGSDDFVLNVYPSSQPVFFELNKQGTINKLMEAGATVKTAFCGPCFGAGDVPTNNGLSIRHTTRNFPNREGSKPSDGQIASVALMDARSITATAISGGLLTPATEVYVPDVSVPYTFNSKIYENRVYRGFGKADPTEALKFGPNIKDWPSMISLTDNILLKVACVIHDDVTTTDELIPSGETSSYRSNPLRLAEFTLSRKDPEYVERSKSFQVFETERRTGQLTDEIKDIYTKLGGDPEELMKTTALGSVIYAKKPGDGSAREQAASCQKVLGGWGNIAQEYATKRYRSNLVNWGLLPFITKDADFDIEMDGYVFVKDVRSIIESGGDTFPATVIEGDKTREITLYLPDMTASERDIILSGCLINYYQSH